MGKSARAFKNPAPHNKYYHRNRRLIERRKARPCEMCGVPYPHYVMEFDHRDPTQKRFNIAQQWRYVSITQLLTEINHCRILCANCHRERTYGGR